MGRVWFNAHEHITSDFEDLIIFEPKITNAYFAEKVVSENSSSNTLTVAFNEIHQGILGRDVYIVVETEGFVPIGESIFSEIRANLKINFKTGDCNLTGTADEVLQITDGAADVSEFVTQVGSTEVLNDTEGNCVYTNLEDYVDKAIFKVSFRPNTRDTFDEWAENIYKLGMDLPSIVIQVLPEDDNMVVVYGANANSWTQLPGDNIFANSEGHLFKLENKNVYEIYHGDNLYNFNVNFEDYENIQRRRPISKLINTSTDDIVYIYRDLYDNEHKVCEREVFETLGKHRGSIPNNYNQAQIAFEDILLSLNPHPVNQNSNIPIFTKDYSQTNDALVQNDLTVTPSDLFQMLAEYKNLINQGTIDSEIEIGLSGQPQNLQTFMNNSTLEQRQNMFIIEGVLDQTSYSLEGVDARLTCEYPLGVVTSGDTKTSSIYRRYYENLSTNVKLIDAQFEPLVSLTSESSDQLALNYTKGSLTISFSYRASRRRYANPDLLAGFIGALAQLNYVHNAAHVISSGFSFSDASCYPSSGHVNGLSCDTYYFNQIGSQENYQQPFINALWDYGFNLHYIACNRNYMHGTRDCNPIQPNAVNVGGIHNSHLHSSNFNRQNTHDFIQDII